MAETDTQTAAAGQAEAETIEAGEFAALLQKEFKPKTDRAREAVEARRRDPGRAGAGSRPP